MLPDCEASYLLLNRLKSCYNFCRGSENSFQDRMFAGSIMKCRVSDAVLAESEKKDR